ncbi:MAG: lipid A biosynthesis acyltransferase [Betaproteobacteria bacterium RBG_19FT_COMBO_58_11]|nr:MAG: lipid A biosynthesis acyltransferase [Betaproteobacteria bacterium RBG_19FT_COMBO_58_11]
MIRVAIFCFWALHFLPLALLNPLGQGLGLLFYALGRERREVARTNLRLCFPELSERERERRVRRHFCAFGRSFLERGILWWSSAARIKRIVRIEGEAHWQALRGKPLILLAPHFVGLDMGGSRLSIDVQVASMYSKQKNPLADRLLLQGRRRFNTPRLFSRQDSVRSVVKAVRDGTPFYYLPDMDFGARDSIFVPFFGVLAATITGVSRMARMAGARVVPAVTRQLPGGQGYVLTFYPAWENFPSDDIAADTRRVNAFIEERVREMPEQYYWLHKRFKTRPAGEQRLY